MRKGSVKTLSVALAGVMVAGCATIMHGGSKQRVLISSDPIGAIATIDNSIKIQTPGEVKLKRGKDHVVVFEKPGYNSGQILIDRDFSYWVVGNIVFGGLIGLAVDFGTGSAWNLDPSTITVTLTPSKVAAAPETKPQ